MPSDSYEIDNIIDFNLVEIDVYEALTETMDWAGDPSVDRASYESDWNEQCREASIDFTNRLREIAEKLYLSANEKLHEGGYY